MPLVIPVNVLINTPPEVLFDHIKRNSENVRKWIKSVPAHDGVAVICGSGPSLEDTLEEIKTRKGKVFALNAAAKFLNDNGIHPDYQVVVDAKEESLSLIGEAKEHIFGSTINPKAFEIKPEASLVHFQVEDDELQEFIDDHSPDEYAMLGNTVSVGVLSLLLAYTMGYREFHFYGLDSSHRDNNSHVVRQKMNDVVACMEVEFCKKKYIASYPMKMQAERFMQISDHLKKVGCEIEVHGSGLLPDMYNAPYEELSEKEKYTRMWCMLTYREGSPAERLVDKIIDLLKPDGKIVDFGCGPARAALKIQEKGYKVLCVDFAPNCRDAAAEDVPFVELDLTEPMPLREKYGYCVDVMEHIQPELVEKTFNNIMASAEKVVFQICTIADHWGATIGHPLHITVKPFAWWKETIERLGYKITFSEEQPEYSLFLVNR